MDEKIKGRFGFGIMRLPKIQEEIDLEQTRRMVDYFISSGFNYFDTAHGYLDKKSELIVKETLTSRYERSEYVLTDKLTYLFFNTEEEIRPLFFSQLERCGVSYFDYYLIHTVSKNNIEHYRKTKAFETVKALKDEGYIKHIGFSFHDMPDFLDELLREFPYMEVVQLQFNYFDYENPAVRSRECYEVAMQHEKEVIVMEPIRGGSLASISEEARNEIDSIGSTPADLALRFVSSFNGVRMILSGMSTYEQVVENTSTMNDERPLTSEEEKAIANVVSIINSREQIPCTDCRYCIPECPKSIPIPDLFKCYNAETLITWENRKAYKDATEGKGKAGECIKCGLCEAACPQHIEIRKSLELVKAKYE